MRIKKPSKKMAVITGAVALTLSAAGIAAAYFTSTGTGTGSASDGNVAPGSLHIQVFNSTTQLLPTAIGDPNAVVGTVDYVVVNTSESDVNVGRVGIAVLANATGTALAYTATTTNYLPITTCKASWFSVTGKSTPATTKVTQTHATEVLKPHSDAPKTGRGAPWTTPALVTDTYYGVATIQLVESDTNQNTCETAHPAVKVSAGVAPTWDLLTNKGA